MNGTTIIDEAMKTGKRNTWFKRHASITYALKNNLNENLKKYKLMFRRETKIFAAEYRLEIESNIRKLIKFYNQIPADIVFNEKRFSKSNELKYLPDDWRQQVLMLIDEKYFFQTLTMAITGCRPQELLNGIQIQRYKNKLNFIINGAKVKDGTILLKNQNGEKGKVLSNYQAGQYQRILEFKLNNEMSDLMSDMIRFLDKNYPGDNKIEVPKILNKKTFASAVNRAGSKLLRNMLMVKPSQIHFNITPYCFRHQFGSDLKKSKMKEDDISLMLGHAVNTTKERYGRKTTSAGGQTPSNVKATLRKENPERVNVLTKRKNYSNSYSKDTIKNLNAL